MADFSVARAKHSTLSGSTPDLVRLTGTFPAVEIINRDDSVYLYVKVEQRSIVAADAAAEGDDTIVIPPNRVLTERLNGAGQVWVAVAGSSNAYSVQGAPSLGDD